MAMFFSDFASNLGGPKNPLYVLHERLKTEGHPMVDLVRGNVNEHGIVYPPEILREILAGAGDRARVYRPDSLGQWPAREAIAQYYGSLRVPPEQILITPGTSVSYWYCFKLLAERGDEMLCPQPSYPLFDYIARLAGVEMTHYRLVESRQWAIDLDYLENQITVRTRAIILISRHNPTGMVADEEQLRGLAEIATRHSLPIISDEVFGEFLFGRDAFPRIATTDAPLVFTLNGLSKMFALPGMKIGWMAVTGDAGLVRKSMARLDLISVRLLPVNEICPFRGTRYSCTFLHRSRKTFLSNFPTLVFGTSSMKTISSGSHHAGRCEREASRISSLVMRFRNSSLGTMQASGRSCQRS